MSFATNPLPLGKLTPNGSVGLLVVANILSSLESGGRLSDLLIQADAANTGTIYVCSNSASPATDSYAHVLRELSAGAFYSAGSGSTPGQVNTNNYYIFGNGTDFCVGEAREV